MRIVVLIGLLISSLSGFACTEVLRPYIDECQAQDRFLKLTTEFKSLSINITELKGFKIPKALGKSSYYSSKNDFLNHSEAALSKNKDWQLWNNGQNFINELNPINIDLFDITRLHKNIYAGKSFFSTPAEVGKLRINYGITNPKIIFSCSEKVLSENLSNLLSDYDLKSAEGYPLLTLQNIKTCDDKNFSSADLLFYKGASVKIELARWLIDMNDMLYRYENGSAPSDFGPYKYLSDMRRWFLAIRPFAEGNDEVASALMDYAAKRLQLAPLSLSDTPNPIFQNFLENRENTLRKVKETLVFFEGCLFDTKTKVIASECSSL